MKLPYSADNGLWSHPPQPPILDGKAVVEIHADLTAGKDSGAFDLTRAKPLKENIGVSYRGTTNHAQQGALPLAGEVSQAIAAAAKQLNALRESWLNPREWVDWVRTPEEEQAGFSAAPGRQTSPSPQP